MNDTTLPGIDVPTLLDAPCAPPEPNGQPRPDPAAPLDSSGPPVVRPRLWPAAVCILLQWIFLVVPAWFAKGEEVYMAGLAIGPAIGLFGFLISWIFFSRIPWRDRWQPLVVCALTFAAIYPLLHESFRSYVIAWYAPPIVATAWLLWFLVTPFLRWPVRRFGLMVVLLLVWSYFPMVRLIHTDGYLRFHMEWRFFLTDAERHQAERNASSSAVPAVVWKWGDDDAARFAAERLKQGVGNAPIGPVLKLQPGDWPGFRGANRDSQLHGVRINADWRQFPPRELWRKRVGPGWSSCTIIGKRLFTQEQIADDEAVVCYDTDKGDILWTHLTPGKFFEQLGGLGPRATPTFHEGKIYALGAMGRLNCLDAASGRPIWSVSIKDHAGAAVPTWGFSSSPLVMQGNVIVYAGGPNNNALLAYNALSGSKVWNSGDGPSSYCSPHPAKLGGVEQVLIATPKGLAGYNPATGAELWHHEYPSGGLVRVVQPSVIDDGTVLIGAGLGYGIRQVNVRRNKDQWEATAGWTSLALKPHFNDFVVHKGHAYGFDTGLFTCVNLDKKAKNKWRERGHDNGQVLLLADQDLLLVQSEHGDLCLVEANPASYVELPGRFQAMGVLSKNTTTWNHPVIAHGRLFVRNSAEIACYELSKP